VSELEAPGFNVHGSYTHQTVIKVLWNVMMGKWLQPLDYLTMEMKAL
jgi:hypothetical protein